MYTKRQEKRTHNATRVASTQCSRRNSNKARVLLLLTKTELHWLWFVADELYNTAHIKSCTKNVQHFIIQHFLVYEYDFLLNDSATNQIQ